MTKVEKKPKITMHCNGSINEDVNKDFTEDVNEDIDKGVIFDGDDRLFTLP